MKAAHKRARLCSLGNKSGRRSISFLMPLLKVISSCGKAQRVRSHAAAAPRSGSEEEESAALSTSRQSWGSVLTWTLRIPLVRSSSLMSSILAPADVLLARARGRKGSQRLYRLWALLLTSRHHFDFLILCWLVLLEVFFLGLFGEGGRPLRGILGLRLFACQLQCPLLSPSGGRGDAILLAAGMVVLTKRGILNNRELTT